MLQSVLRPASVFIYDVEGMAFRKGGGETAISFSNAFSWEQKWSLLLESFNLLRL